MGHPVQTVLSSQPLDAQPTKRKGKGSPKAALLLPIFGLLTAYQRPHFPVCYRNIKTHNNTDLQPLEEYHALSPFARSGNKFHRVVSN